ncbi:MAG: DUF3857 domain-containing protein [Candidatus Acidiferrales bacterium]
MRRLPNFAAFCLILAGTIFFLAPRGRAAADWPPISQDELALNDNPAEPGATAMILNHENVINNRDSREDQYYRIKIFTEAGKNLANIEIGFVKGLFDVKNVEGRTVHPDGKIIEFDGQVLQKTVIKSGEFNVDVKYFTLPDVTPGSIIEYRYRVQFPQLIVRGANWIVQDKIYTKHAHFVYFPPSPPQGYTFLSGVLWRTYRLPNNIAPEKQKDGSFTLDMNDVAGVPEEDYMMPIDELRGRVEFFFSGVTHPKIAKEYWDSTAKDWAEEDERYIGKRTAIRDLVGQITKPEDSPDVKLRKFYDRAQEVRNLSFESSKTEQEEKRENAKDNNNVEDVLKHNYAGKIQINLFYVAMAQAAGFDSSLLRAAPRDKGRFHPDLQETKELSSDFVWVHAGDKDYFLDPGELYCPFGLLPWAETAIPAMRSTKQGSLMIQVPPIPSTASGIERRAQLTLDGEGSLSGTLTVRYTGQRALSRRIQGRNEDREGRKKELESEIRHTLPTDARFEITDITGWEKAEEPLTVEGRLVLPGMTETAGRRLLIPIGLYESTQRQLFEPSSRKQDIYFSYPYQELDDITLQLPSNMKAVTLPPPQSLDPGGNLKYEITAGQEGDKIHIQRKLIVGSMLYPVNAYPAIRKFFGTAKSDDEQQIVIQLAAATGNN